MDCLMTAWNANEQAIKSWLLKKTGDRDQTQDLLQDLFIKALQNKERFCTLTDAKSWLFKIAKNSVVDVYRKSRLEIGSVCCEDVQEDTTAPIVNLQQCLLRVLCELDEDDKDVIEQCDMHGLSQLDYARIKGLSLSATKSRIQRARKKLREQMIVSCNVELDQRGVRSFTPRK
ncbi:MAG: sigma-70 family RNA polymerase sigma factor [Psychromonas sp.]|nr:sigma-70 family RNA polymerase sigma factor [Psychromonas sp.]